MYASRVLARASRNVRSSSSLFSASPASIARSSIIPNSSNPIIREPQNKATLLHQTAIKSFGFQRHGISTTASPEFIKKKEIHVSLMTRILRVAEAWGCHIEQGAGNILADYVHNGVTRNVMMLCVKLLMLIVSKDVLVTLLL